MANYNCYSSNLFNILTKAFQAQSKIYIIGGMRSRMHSIVEMNDFIEFDILTEEVSTIHRLV